MLFVFDAPNGYGKSSTIELIKQKLETMDHKVTIVKAPDYKGVYGEEILKYLSGQVDIDPEEIDIKFQLNRMEIQEKQIIPALQQGNIVLADRFSLSGKVYSVLRHQQKDPSYKIDYEYLNQLVKDEIKPQKTFILFAETDVIVQRLQQRGVSQIYYDKQSLTDSFKLFLELKEGNSVYVDNNVSCESVVDYCINTILQDYDAQKKDIPSQIGEQIEHKCQINDRDQSHLSDQAVVMVNLTD